MTTLLIVSAVLAVLYVGAAIAAKRELPESISSLVYLLPRQGRWVWIVWMWAIAVLSGIPAIEVLSAKGLEWLGYAMMCCLAFCGAMPIVKDGKNTAHNIFGVSAGIVSQVIVLVVDYQWLELWLLFAFIIGSAYIQPMGWMGKGVKGKTVFVAEAVCTVAWHIALFLSLT